MNQGINEFYDEELESLLDDSNTNKPGQQTSPSQQGQSIPQGEGDNNNGSDLSRLFDNKDNDEEGEIDLISSLLKSKGIDNPEKIKFVNEDDEIEEVDWNNLSTEEKFNILTQQEDNSELEDEEYDIINAIRESRLNPRDWVDYIRQEAISEYAESLETSQSFEVDAFSDEELFILDLKSRIEDMTDEELQLALAHAKENEYLFNKQMLGLRNEYKSLENIRREEDAFIEEENARREMAQFSNEINAVVQNLSKTDGFPFELNEDDMLEVSEFILGTDKAGVRYLQRALSDPATLVKMSWFATQGDKALEDITSYFKKEIKNVRESAYNKGLEDGKKGTTSSNYKVVQKQTNSKNTQVRSGELTPVDLYYELLKK